MRLRALAFMLCLGVCSMANATLMVGTSPDPVTLVPGGTFSTTIELQSPDNHAVTGGRLVLMIQPISGGGSVGDVQFNTSLPGIPNGAITNSGSKYAITTALPGNPGFTAGNTMANVFWTPTTPGQIPVTPNDAAFDVNYVASASATGTYGLFLVYDTSVPIGTTSHWRGAGTTPGTSTLGAAFDMTFDANGKALIGTIAVPEPGSFALMGLIGLAVGGKGCVSWMRRRREEREGLEA